MEPIVSQGNIGVSGLRQPRNRFGVRQFVRNVREPRAARLEFSDQFQRLLHGLMHRMRNISQRINNQIVQIREQRFRTFRQLAEVRKIRSLAKSKSENTHISMLCWHGNNLHSYNLEWPI